VQLVERHGLVPGETVYVGDRFENDILPAQKAGLSGALLRRGPWGFVNDLHPDAKAADLRICSLHDLSVVISEMDAARG
jgi:FMN phosphatase YigB (HAD superfamily)